MFRKMLVCTDLTPDSHPIVDCVAALKQIGMEEVVLAHVIHFIQLADTAGLEQSLAAAARAVVELQKSRLEEQGVKVTVEVQTGRPARTLHRIAEEHDVSAIAIGSRNKGIIKAAALGSVSAGLLRLTARPLFLVRSELLEQGDAEVTCGKTFSRILFPSDFSETAERALDYVGKIARETGAPVTLMHVIAAKDDPAEALSREEEARYLLQAKKRRLEAAGAAEVTTDLVYGAAAEEIVGRTKSGEYSLAVIGAQGKGFLEEFFLGSTASEVARQAGLPLLLIPAQRS